MMTSRIIVLFASVFGILSSSASTICAADDWKAGVAAVNITPGEPMWMSGYGDRNKPAEGKLTDLWAKALVLEDPAGHRAVLVTLDLVGIGRDTSLAVRQQLEEKFGLKREQVALNCSHTHTGPVVGRNLAAMYFLDEEQWKRVDEYDQALRAKIVKAVGAALEKLAPAKLAWGVGSCDVAVNRRENPEADVPKLRAEGKLKGPFDHDVPVLQVAGDDGEPRAIVFGYACHATVLNFYQWSGDWPGFAQIELEEAYPGAVAMFWAGGGAAQNPLPRRTVKLAQEFGRRIVESVEDTLEFELQPIAGKLKMSYEEIDLAFAKLPSRDELIANTMSKDRYEKQRAEILLQRLDSDGELSATYPYPVQAWRLGDEVLFITLGGEVVVDFAHRLKADFGRRRTWVAGYTNDVMAYIPSLRVLREGRYEGGGAMVYYGLPSPWSEAVEEHIVQAVHRRANAVGVEVVKP
jgi:hypothetical protein